MSRRKAATLIAHGAAGVLLTRVTASAQETKAMTLLQRMRQKPLPDWAAEFDCHSWAQFFLKWILAHPAVTCAIPATNKSRHLEDNMQAGAGRLPDETLRKRMLDVIPSW